MKIPEFCILLEIKSNNIKVISVKWNSLKMTARKQLDKTSWMWPKKTECNRMSVKTVKKISKLFLYYQRKLFILILKSTSSIKSKPLRYFSTREVNWNIWTISMIWNKFVIKCTLITNLYQTYSVQIWTSGPMDYFILDQHIKTKTKTKDTYFDYE